MALQLTTTNLGCVLAMARATSSLPTPDSPRINTAPRLWAAFSTMRYRFWTGALWPTIFSKLSFNRVRKR